MNVPLIVGALSCVALIGATWCVRSILATRRRATCRAEWLLHQLLTPQEVQCLSVHGHLDARSPSTPERVYRIPADPGLVTVIDDGVASAWLCAHPAHSIPAAEHVLVHKLLLEGAEAEYLQRANRYTCRIAPSPNARGQVAVWTGRAPGILGQR